LEDHSAAICAATAVEISESLIAVQTATYSVQIPQKSHRQRCGNSPKN
jgi:hypothetical protein